MVQFGRFCPPARTPLRDRIGEGWMLSVQEEMRRSRHEKTKKTKTLPGLGAAFVFSVFAAGRKLRVIS